MCENQLCFSPQILPGPGAGCFGAAGLLSFCAGLVMIGRQEENSTIQRHTLNQVFPMSLGLHLLEILPNKGSEDADPKHDLTCRSP